MPMTSAPTSTTSPAGSWPIGIPWSWPGMPPIEMKSASVPQIPHARILTSTSAGPTVGVGASITCVSPGAVTTDIFMRMLLYAGSWL
jgi:hypothetical protein